MKKILVSAIGALLIGVAVGATRINQAQAIDDPLIREPITLEQRMSQYERDVDSTPNLTKTTSEIILNAQLNAIVSIVGKQDPEDITGAIPALTGLMASMYENKPASTHTFLADLSRSARIVPQAQAQGIGFASLDPIMFVWKTFRNIAYFLFVLIFLATGFMIMFRQKINGQVVVTVEQAIPNIIVALIFVTFSYAIGGLLIDAMYLIMYLIVGLFQQDNSILNSNILKLGLKLLKTGFESGNEAMSNLIEEIVNAGNVGEAFSFISSITVGFIVAMAVLFGVFKLFLELIKSYISIILSIAFAPMILMAGAIPGQNTFKGWLKNLIANLASFPAVLLLLIIQQVIDQSSIGHSTGGFMPPFLLSQGASAGAMPSVIGIGILLTIPEIIKKIKDKMGASEGIVGELAGVAASRIKQSANKFAAPVIGAQAGIAGGIGGYAAGAISGIPKRARGEITDQQYSEIVRRSAAKGARIGAGLPMAAKIGPQFIKSQYSVIKDQLQQKAAADMMAGAHKAITDYSSEHEKAAESNIVKGVLHILDPNKDPKEREEAPKVDESLKGSREKPANIDSFGLNK